MGKKEETQLKKDLGDLKEDMKKLEKLVTGNANPTDADLKKWARTFDDCMKTYEAKQNTASDLKLNVNTENKSYVKHAKVCWPYVTKAAFTWSEETKANTKGWGTVAFTSEVGQNLEDKKGETPYEMQNKGEAEFMENQAEHWRVKVEPQLKKELAFFVKIDAKGTVALQPGAYAVVSAQAQTVHDSAFKLKMANPTAFAGLFQPGSRGSKLVSACIDKQTEILKAELANVRKGVVSQVFTLTLEPDYESADEHWQLSFLPLLIGFVNGAIGKNPSLSVSTAQSGAAQTIERFFQPLRADHTQAFQTGKLSYAHEQNDRQNWPAVLQDLVKKALLQINTALKAVLESKKDTEFFCYTPMK
jgi:hypothetical protein